LFSLVSVVPTDKVKVIKNAQKLKVVDPNTLIQRYACTGRGTHLHGLVTRPDHPFTRLTFIRTELSKDQGRAARTFAAFVSPVIENGTKPDQMDGIRARLTDFGLPPSDALSPGLVD
jgi:S-(hydroxymethyl)glutathione synthase